MQETRLLAPVILDETWGRQMRFIAGPRQCGKTTLAQKILKEKKSSDLYFNWDDLKTRQGFKKETYDFYQDIQEHKFNPLWVCFDEVHKTKYWKNILKSYFDKYENNIRFIVTGSARLDLFRRSGDSLRGRYTLFRMMPMTLAELNHSEIFFECDAEKFIETKIATFKKSSKENLENLLRFSGFPEPLFKSSTRFHQTWQKRYHELSIYEDLRELSQIRDLDAVALMVDLLPDKVASQFSLNSLREDLEINYQTAANYLKYLELSYLIFSIKPYSKSIARAVKKEPKIYFYDWTRVKDEAARLENYIACELLTMTQLWTDTGYANAELAYVRTKDGKETDFLILIDKKPWLLIEVKLKQTEIANHHYRHAEALGKIPILQLTYGDTKILKPSNNSYVAPAMRFLG